MAIEELQSRLIPNSTGIEIDDAIIRIEEISLGSVRVTHPGEQGAPPVVPITRNKITFTIRLIVGGSRILRNYRGRIFVTSLYPRGAEIDGNYRTAGTWLVDEVSGKIIEKEEITQGDDGGWVGTMPPT